MDVEPGRQQWMVQIDDPCGSDKVDGNRYNFSVDDSQMEPDREDNHPGPPEDVPLDIVIEERAPENPGLV